MKESAGNLATIQAKDVAAKARVWESISRLTTWLEVNEWKGYDTFDGLSSGLLRPLTFETKFLRTVLQQGVRRFPINVRPLVGIKKSYSSKGMGFLARGFIRLFDLTGDPSWKQKAVIALDWLMENQSPGYSGACWGNHFDYQSRGFYLPKGMPTIVWTSHIAHSFLDAFERFGEQRYLETAVSACEHILQDLGTFADGRGVCLNYIPTQSSNCHNSNTLGASLLARTYAHTRNESYLALAESAMHYTAQYQRADGSWFYAEATNSHWVDNFHTAYVLDCFKWYAQGSGDHQFDGHLRRGYEYWKATFFLSDGTPRYYDRKTWPIDIQCSSQAIDTLLFFHDMDPDSTDLALKVAEWTITHMQDASGYFYYRRYPLGIVNKTPTLHWGQATMLSALASLYGRL